MYFLLQKVILPNIDLCTEEQLYFRTQGGKYNYTSRNLLVPRHKVAYLMHSQLRNGKNIQP